MVNQQNQVQLQTAYNIVNETTVNDFYIKYFCNEKH